MKKLYNRIAIYPVTFLMHLFFSFLSVFNPNIVYSGCNYPSNLEITCINIGQGDATLIASNSELMLADAGESYWNSHNDALKIDRVIREKYGDTCKTIDVVLISHIHLDHIGYIQASEDENDNLLDEDGRSYEEGDNLLNPKFYGGLAYLVKELGYDVGTTYFRDYKSHNPNKAPQDGGSKTYRNWRAYLESPEGKKAFNPKMAVLGNSQIDIGTINNIPIIIDVIVIDGMTPSNPEGCDPDRYFNGDTIWGDLSNLEVPPSENDYSLGFIISFGDFQMFIGGDLSGENFESQYGYKYHDVESCLAEDYIVKKLYGRHLEVLRINHHGSSHSTNIKFINAFDPQIAIFSVGDHNTYGHVDSQILDNVLTKVVKENHGRVLMTECGDKVFQPEDVCHSEISTLCAEVVDGEFPQTVESDELGDANVHILVSNDGKRFTVQDHLQRVVVINKSMPWMPLLLLDD